VKYKIYRIKWDTDGETYKSLGLPTSLVIDTDELGWEINNPNDEDEIADIVSDWLSDEYGYCHDGFLGKKL
jgi:hypothetical protein